MAAIEFTKMHGLGNDFMVVNATQQRYVFRPELIQQWADRHRGIGFEQLLLIDAARQGPIDFFYRIFNADGTEAEQCGNGLRCITKYIHDKQLSTQALLKIGTLTGVHTAEYISDTLIKVTMGKPTKIRGLEPLALNEQNALGFSLAIGNPHTVIQVADVAKAPLSEWGPRLNQSEQFPQGVNVGFMQIITPAQIKLRVFERGVGETLACGSGACAAVIAGYLQGLLANEVTVFLPGGQLFIQLAADQTITLSGAAATVYEGCIEL